MGDSTATEVYAGETHLAGLQLTMERVEVRTQPPSVTFRFGRPNWATTRTSTIAGARAVYLADRGELLIATHDNTLVVTGARLISA